MIQTLRGHYGSAASHLKSGVRIIEESISTEISADDSEEGRLAAFRYVSKEKLLPLFTRLDHQVQQVS